MLKRSPCQGEKKKKNKKKGEGEREKKIENPKFLSKKERADPSRPNNFKGSEPPNHHPLQRMGVWTTNEKEKSKTPIKKIKSKQKPHALGPREN